MAAATAASRLASSSTTSGFLPPISSWNLAPRVAQAMATRAPVSTEPVKEMALTSCESSMVWPTTEPRPMTRFTTPLGKPAREMISISAQAVPGTRSAGLQHHRVAEGQRRRHLPGGDGDGEVPRADQTDDAQRLAGQHHVDAGAHRRDCDALDAQRFLREELEDLGGTHGLGDAVGERLSLFARRAAVRSRPCGPGVRRRWLPAHRPWPAACWRPSRAVRPWRRRWRPRPGPHRPGHIRPPHRSGPTG